MALNWGADDLDGLERLAAEEVVAVGAGQPVVAGEDVGPDLLVRGAQVRQGVHVVDGRRDVEVSRAHG